MGSRNLTRRETFLHSELEALRWAMESMIQHSTCQRFGTDCKDLIAMIQEPQAWPNFSTELEIIQTLRLCFSDFKISYFPRTQNEIADSLVRNARSFYRPLCFIGRSISSMASQTTSSLTNKITKKKTQARSSLSNKIAFDVQK